MVTAEGTVKIADFGIAKATGQAYGGSFLTATGTTVGTPSYMAPEQAMGKEIGPWTDLYSVGVMAYEMLVGQVPFHDTETPMAVLMRQVSDPIPPARSLNPEIDQATSDWIERMLVKEPARSRSVRRRGVGRARGDRARARGPPLAAVGSPPRALAAARRHVPERGHTTRHDRHRPHPDGAHDTLADHQAPHHVRGPHASRGRTGGGGTGRDRHAAPGKPAGRRRRRAATAAARAAPRRAPEDRARGVRGARRAGGRLRRARLGPWRRDWCPWSRSAGARRRARRAVRPPPPRRPPSRARSCRSRSPAAGRGCAVAARQTSASRSRARSPSRPTATRPAPSSSSA